MTCLSDGAPFLKIDKPEGKIFLKKNTLVHYELSAYFLGTRCSQKDIWAHFEIHSLTSLRTFIWCRHHVTSSRGGLPHLFLKIQEKCPTCVYYGLWVHLAIPEKNQIGEWGRGWRTYFSESPPLSPEFLGQGSI